LRRDMFKVIVERPRYGHHERGGRCTRYPLKEDAENLPKQESIGKKYKIGFEGKQLSENLNPLWRFFESRVGQVWNDVWSEVCQNLNNNSTVQKHVKDHAKDYVETNIIMDGDQPYYHPKYSYQGHGWKPLYSTKKNPELYANPETGLLSVAPIKPPKERSKDWWKVVKCDDGSEHQWYDGVWWNVKVVIEKYKVVEPAYGYAKDPVTNKTSWVQTGTRLVEKKIERKIWRQLNKKDIKALYSWFRGEVNTAFERADKPRYVNK